MIKKSGGFTLIELLVVVAILSVLAVTVFVALNPAKRIKDAKDARRLTDLNSILSAVHTCIVDNKGDKNNLCGLPAAGTEVQLGTATTGCALATGGCAVAATDDCLDLTSALAKYLKTIPVDPDGTTALTGYSLVVDTNGIVTVKACGAEGGVNLSASR